MNTALEYSTRVVQEGGRRCKKSTLNDSVHLTPLRIPLMNPPKLVSKYSTFWLYSWTKELKRHQSLNVSLLVIFAWDGVAIL
jgi:hypothetical protein